MARKSSKRKRRQTMFGAATSSALRMQRVAVKAATEAATVAAEAAAEAVMKSLMFGENALGVRGTKSKRRTTSRKTVRRKRR
jgi:hypothetical protein